MRGLLGKGMTMMRLMIARRKYASAYLKFRKYTMIPPETYIANLELVKRHMNVSGAIVECGTWKGGMIAGMADMLGKKREYYLFDSFEGLPPAQEIDGQSAIDWQETKDPDNYYDNCTAAEADARAAMKSAGISNPNLVKGWFSETLPGKKFQEGIAILRMDADWYESTMDIFRNLFDQVNPGGLILIDDYYTWDGCSRAVHDYLSEHKLTERIWTHRGVCFMVKK